MLFRELFASPARIVCLVLIGAYVYTAGILAIPAREEAAAAA